MSECYGCETWFLTLREVHKLTIFKNRVPIKTLASTRGKVTGGWRQLHSEKPHDMYSSPNIN